MNRKQYPLSPDGAQLPFKMLSTAYVPSRITALVCTGSHSNTLGGITLTADQKCRSSKDPELIQPSTFDHLAMAGHLGHFHLV